MKRGEQQICSNKAMKHTFKVCNRLWVERNTSKLKNGFVWNVSNTVLPTSPLYQTWSMMIAEGAVFLVCCVSPRGIPRLE